MPDPHPLDVEIRAGNVQLEGTLTLRDVQRILLAVAAGNATGLEGSTMVFKSQDGATDRVAATYSSGARTVTTVDAT